MEVKRYKVRLNSVEKIEELLQEIYDQACRQITEIQNEMNKLVNSTNMAEEGFSIDAKATYAKSIHDFIGDKQKAIAAKFEVAKLTDGLGSYHNTPSDVTNFPILALEFAFLHCLSTPDFIISTLLAFENST